MPNKLYGIDNKNGNWQTAQGYHFMHASQSSSQQAAPSSSPPGNNRGIRPTQRRSGGIVLIPIGLIITLIIAVFRMVSGPAQKNSYPESDVSILNSGLNSYDRGDYKNALMYFNIAIASQPEMGEAYNDRGLTYYALGEFENALADFNKAIALLPDPAISFSNRGGLYLSQGNHEQALADLDKAIQLSPRLAKAYHNRGLTYLDLGNYDLAIADFDQAIELTPELMFTLQATMQSREPAGESLFSSGFYTGLMNRETYADLPSAYASRAIAYIKTYDYAKAAADLTKATQLGLDMSFVRQIEMQLPVSTSVPQIEQTSAGSTPAIQLGHWEGSAIPLGVQGTISFDIWADGQIHDFTLHLSFASGSTCKVSASDVLVQPDGSFFFTFNTFGIESGIITQGQFKSSTSVDGNLSGPIQCITSVGELINGGQSMGDPWSAQWIYGP